MTISVLYFGMLAECTGQTSEGWEIEENASVSELTAALFERYPVLRDRKFRIAVNQQIADSTTPLLPHSQVALLPPFAGG